MRGRDSGPIRQCVYTYVAGLRTCNHSPWVHVTPLKYAVNRVKPLRGKGLDAENGEGAVPAARCFGDAMRTPQRGVAGERSEKSWECDRGLMAARAT